MDRISTATKATDLFGTGKHGFKDGNLGLGIAPTDFNAEWCNGLQEELLALIEGAGLTPTAGTRNQVYLAVQAMIAGSVAQDYKASARAATTANIATLAGGAPNTLDGVTLAANDRILVKDQTTASQNGVYYVTTLGTGANGTWTRSTDADQAGELTSGAIIAIEEGTVNADSQWMLTTDGAITIGTTSLVFARKDAGAASGVAAGAVGTFAQSTAPTGWLKANGAAISRTTYAALFAAIGTTYGVGDGSTTFNIPDLRGQFIRGWVDNGSIDTGRAFGSSQTDALQNLTGSYATIATNGPSTLSGVFTTSTAGGAGSGAVMGTGNYASTMNFNASSVARTSTETRPTNVALLACIKY